MKLQFIIVMVVTGYMVFVSCDSREPGCLNIESENYDVNAVSECDSCCVFPLTTLSVGFEYDTFDFSFIDTFPYQGMDSVRISYLQLPFSEFLFIDGAQAYTMSDSIRGEVPKVVDDFLVIESTNRSEPIGRSAFATRLDSMAFRLGMDPEVTLGLKPFEDVSVASQFIATIEDMYVDSSETLVQARLSLSFGDSVRQLEIMEIIDPVVVLPLDFDIEPGFPWSVGINVDMRTLIEGISPSDTNEMMAATIGQNLSAAILPQ